MDRPNNGTLGVKVPTAQINLSAYQALLFDLDGTLVATEQAYIDSSAELLSAYGQLYDVPTHRQFMSRDTISAAQWLVDSLNLPLSAKAFLQQRNALAFEHFSTAKEVAGVNAFFTDIYPVGFKLGIATSSLRVNAQRKLNGRIWSRYFDTWVCGDDAGVAKRKPAADIFLLCAQKLAVLPQHCLVFEDSPAGIAAAKAAKMDVVAVMNPDISLLNEADIQDCVGQIDDYRTLMVSSE